MPFKRALTALLHGIRRIKELLPLEHTKQNTISHVKALWNTTWLGNAVFTFTEDPNPAPKLFHTDNGRAMKVAEYQFQAEVYKYIYVWFHHLGHHLNKHRIAVHHIRIQANPADNMW